MPWLRCHNPEIDWKTGEIKMMRCPDKCGKKWRIGKQTKPGWKKQEEKEEKIIARIMEEKKEKEKDLIELRVIEENGSKKVP